MTDPAKDLVCQSLFNLFVGMKIKSTEYENLIKSFVARKPKCFPAINKQRHPENWVLPKFSQIKTHT